MADADFESRLLRLFDQPPAFADADFFAHTVEARLDRGWGLRQLMIGAFGVIGGVIGAMQMVGSGLGFQLEKASEQSAGLVTEQLGGWWRSGVDLASMPLSGEVLWMAAALGVMALAFAATRAVEEL
jgi:hypothetical protein